MGLVDFLNRQDEKLMGTRFGQNVGGLGGAMSAAGDYFGAIAVAAADRRPGESEASTIGRGMGVGSQALKQGFADGRKRLEGRQFQDYARQMAAEAEPGSRTEQLYNAVASGNESMRGLLPALWQAESYDMRYAGAGAGKPLTVSQLRENKQIMRERDAITRNGITALDLNFDLASPNSRIHKAMKPLFGPDPEHNRIHSYIRNSLNLRKVNRDAVPYSQWQWTPERGGHSIDSPDPSGVIPPAGGQGSESEGGGFFDGVMKFFGMGEDEAPAGTAKASSSGSPNRAPSGSPEDLVGQALDDVTEMNRALGLEAPASGVSSEPMPPGGGLMSAEPQAPTGGLMSIERPADATADAGNFLARAQRFAGSVQPASGQMFDPASQGFGDFPTTQRLIGGARSFGRNLLEPAEPPFRGAAQGLMGYMDDFSSSLYEESRQRREENIDYRDSFREWSPSGLRGEGSLLGSRLLDPARDLIDDVNYWGSIKSDARSRAAFESKSPWRGPDQFYREEQLRKRRQKSLIEKTMEESEINSRIRGSGLMGY